MPTIKTLLQNSSASQGSGMKAEKIPHINKDGELLKSSSFGVANYYDESVFRDGEIYREAVSLFNKESGSDVKSIFDVDVEFFVKFICKRYSNDKWAEKHIGDNPEKLNIATIRVVRGGESEIMLNNAMLNANIKTEDRDYWRVTKEGLPASLISKNGDLCYSNPDLAIVSQIITEEGLNQIMMLIYSAIQKHQDYEILNAIDEIKLPEFTYKVQRDVYEASIVSLASTILGRNPNISIDDARVAVKARLRSLAGDVAKDLHGQAYGKFLQKRVDIKISNFNDSLKFASEAMCVDEYRDFIGKIEKDVDDIKKSSSQKLPDKADKADEADKAVKDYMLKNMESIRFMYNKMMQSCHNAYRENTHLCLREDILSDTLFAIGQKVSKGASFLKNANLLKEFSNISIHGLFSPDMNEIYSILGIGRSFSYKNRPHLSLKIKDELRGHVVKIGCLEDMLREPKEGRARVSELTSIFGKSSIICLSKKRDEDKLKQLYQSYKDILFEPKNYCLLYSKSGGFKLHSLIEVEIDDESFRGNSESIKFLATNRITDNVTTVEIPKDNISKILEAVEEGLEEEFAEELSGELRDEHANKNQKAFKNVSIGNASIVKNQNGNIEVRVGATHILGLDFYKKTNAKYSQIRAGLAANNVAEGGRGAAQNRPKKTYARMLSLERESESERRQNQGQGQSQNQSGGCDSGGYHGGGYDSVGSGSGGYHSGGARHY